MTRAALIAIGSELLGFGREDTNGPWIAARLEASGVETVARWVVSDALEALVPAIEAATRIADVVILTGGLGPTDDDRTREALARALGRPLRHDEIREARLKRRFAAFELPWTDRKARQAYRPEGADWIDNDVGSADGLRVAHGDVTVVALPGVPSEMRPMVEAELTGWLGGDASATTARSTIRVFGYGEADVDARLADLYDRDGVDITILAGPGEVAVAIRSTGGDAAEVRAMLDGVRDEVATRFAGEVAVDDERSLAAIVGDALRERGTDLAVAESCTGGMLAAEVTRVPGSSDWFRGGWVVYHNELKQGLAGIPAETLEEDGAVSETVARGLAEAVRDRCAAGWGIGITGVAGPGGGSADKPVGLVHVALAGPGGTRHWRTMRGGDRDWIRRRTVAFALDRLRRALIEPNG